MEEKLNRLKAYTGRQFIYEDEEITILYFERDKEQVEIITDKRKIKTTFFEVFVLLNKMQEVVKPNLSTPAVLPSASLQIKNENINFVQASLRETLEKVMKDPKHIPQAKAVVDVSKMMIEGEHLKLNIVKTLHKI